jgi:hypothetical protein
VDDFSMYITFLLKGSDGQSRDGCPIPQIALVEGQGRRVVSAARLNNPLRRDIELDCQSTFISGSVAFAAVWEKSKSPRRGKSGTR